MKLWSRNSVLLLLFCSMAVLCACLPIADDLRFNIQIKSLDGLKPGDRVYFKDYSVGKIESICVSKDGSFIIKVCIQDAQRAAALKNHLFILDDDPDLPGKKAIMIKKGEKTSAVPIREGETVTGFTSLSYYLQKNWETIRKTTEELGQTFDRFIQELKELPRSEQYKEKKKKLQEILKAGERYKDKLQQEILPELQRQLEEFNQKVQAKKPEAVPEKSRTQPERHDL